MLSLSMFTFRRLSIAIIDMALFPRRAGGRFSPGTLVIDIPLFSIQNSNGYRTDGRCRCDAARRRRLRSCEAAARERLEDTAARGRRLRPFAAARGRIVATARPESQSHNAPNIPRRIPH